MKIIILSTLYSLVICSCVNTEIFPQEKDAYTNSKRLIKVENVSDSFYRKRSIIANYKYIRDRNRDQGKFLKLWVDLLNLERENDLDYAGFSQNYCRITVQNEGRQIVMRSSHINAEKNPNVVATESGLSNRGDIERFTSSSANSKRYRNFRRIFDGFYQLGTQ